LRRLQCFAVSCAIAWLSSSPAWADSAYKTTSGGVSFNVGTNIPYLSVSGKSSAVSGGGVASVSGNAATVRNLRFEVDPKTLKTGMKLRDSHLYDKVFKASDGSTPHVVLQAARFDAVQKPGTSRWEGTLQAQLTIRGVTKPVVFQASLEKKGKGAIVTAHGTVKTSNFGVAKISYAGATVNDDVSVSVTNLAVEP
jgi:polyisoprenoid-binding protein YceI